MQELQIKWSFIKRDDDGDVDYISPLPCPFNYGSILGTVSEEGDRMDAIVMGGKIRKDHNIKLNPLAEVVFYDAGNYDPKMVFSLNNKLSFLDKLGIRLFFMFFSIAKTLLNKVRRKQGRTMFSELRDLS